MSEAWKTTDAEKQVLTLLAGAWNLFIALDPKPHPTERQEFNAAVNAAQNVLACRLARRADPDVWADHDPNEDGKAPWDSEVGRCKNCGDELYLGQADLCIECDPLLRASEKSAVEGDNETVLRCVKALSRRRAEGRERWANRKDQQ